MHLYWNSHSIMYHLKFIKKKKNPISYKISNNVTENSCKLAKLTSKLFKFDEKGCQNKSNKTMQIFIPFKCAFEKLHH